MTTMKTSIKASLIATAIAMLPFGSHAAGLGSIHVFSGIGQPLRAEIELNATAEELQSMSANVAPADAFKQASLQYSPAIASLRFAVERRGARSVVKISSDRPFSEPFVELLLELNWSAGRMVREYTFLLDPVPVAAQVPAPVAPRPAAASSSARAAVPVSSAENRETSGADRYRVQRGDTLRRIAESNRPSGTSLEQMLVALFRANPDAFDDGNVNRLRAGAIINVPPETEVRAIDPVQARREVLTQSADFQSYRRTLASTVASRPAAAEQAPSRGDAGSIVPKVSEPARSTSGDQVKVSGGAGSSAPSKGNVEDARLARLQALEEEVTARGKALDEANSRLVALEDSIRKMQQLIELRNQGLAQMQQGAGAATPPAAPSAPPPAPEKPAEAALPAPAPAPAAPSAEVAKPIPKPPVPAAPPVTTEEPTFLQSLLDNPTMLAGGGGVLALLLAYAGLKVRQRRQQSGAVSPAAGATSEFPVETNSVFGKTGGQSVNTGESSVLHTDFSQSGLSAIDTDEGVDPVAEADVYMAYGRDAQAEEILLDALKSDGARLAIYVKLLEIYAQRNNAKAFETTATDLYGRTGGEGPEWGKAAEMGRRIDPDNPLYRGSTLVGRAGAGALSGTAAGALAGAASAAAETPAMDFGGPSFDATTQRADEAPFLPTTEPSQPAAVEEVELEALPEIDSNALDFDLDAGLGFDAQSSPSIEVPELNAGELEIDLDIAAASADTPVDVREPELEVESAQLNETVIGEGIEFAAADQGLEFDLGVETPAAAADKEQAAEFNLDATVVGTEEEPTSAPEPVDLEKTTFDSSLLDFDFNLEDAGEAAPVSGVAANSGIDLSSIDLELGTPTEAIAQSETIASPEFEEIALATGGVGPLSGDEGIPADVLEEVNTKLELARAYEEMGDSEGARELLEEVQREGSAEQRQAAAELLGRLG
ncbi:MAG TPA: FimV/HubP family polar landmark protein [Aromatoleum sp.]|uniref:FimV/HubP family polar landmark protein n=1 Tax=Aromatoleum sp. TaxID=2307007 RepID=UPI002B498E5E|nr:FimV/HubP family polar landmark protein [Aromatoleum sp.]HJV27630.1 FimV/HubP family polar landmark protein [Aromatoleum sp.]